MKKPLDPKRGNTLEFLFQDFYRAVSTNFEDLELLFSVKGLSSQVFGESHDREIRMNNLRLSASWKSLEELYDFAWNGLVPERKEILDIVVDGRAILKLASGENDSVGEEWNIVGERADARYALDTGEGLRMEALALLAGVDLRTVRNAVSSGDLKVYKDSLQGENCIQNSSARAWLIGRRGFKPSIVLDHQLNADFEAVQTPFEFGAAIKARRNQMSELDGVEMRAPADPEITNDLLNRLEAGLFDVPLSFAIPIADHLMVDRQKFLACIMRMFFPYELELLTSVKAPTSADALSKGSKDLD